MGQLTLNQSLPLHGWAGIEPAVSTQSQLHTGLSTATKIVTLQAHLIVTVRLEFGVETVAFFRD